MAFLGCHALKVLFLGPISHAGHMKTHRISDWEDGVQWLLDPGAKRDLAYSLLPPTPKIHNSIIETKWSIYGKAVNFFSLTINMSYMIFMWPSDFG